MKIFNTLTRRKEEFVPLEPGKVKMYVCGPTVYNFIHIGNARPMLVFDTVRRYFEYKGYHLDGKSYNRVYLINLRSQVLYGSFNCEIRDKNKWISIIDKLFMNTVEKE